MLAAVPDLRPSLETAGLEELADLLDAFDVTAVYDKSDRTLELGATVTPEVVPENEKPRRSSAPSGIPSIAGVVSWRGPDCRVSSNRLDVGDRDSDAPALRLSSAAVVIGVGY